MSKSEHDWLLTGYLCPACGDGAVKDFNTHPDTRKKTFWASDAQAINCGSCSKPLIRNGAYRAGYDQAAWKIMRDCPCGVSRHGHTDVCEYMIGK